MATHYMTGETRAAQEEAELAAAEAEFNGEQVDPQPADTPAEVPAEEPQEPEVDWQKRYKDLQSHSAKEKNELQAQLKAAGVEPEETDKVAEMEQRLAELQAKEDAREIESHTAQAQAAVGAAHNDFVQVINSSEFAEWIQGQPQVYHDAIYADRPDAQMAIDALTLFKVQSGFTERKAQAAQREQLDQAAMSVSGGHREAPASRQEKTWTWNEIQSLTPQQYDKLEAEIDKAIMEGRVH